MSLFQQIQVQAQRQPFQSRWIAGCLPKSVKILKRSKTVVEAIDDAVGLGNYRSILDAAVAAVIPELRPAMDRFYERKGPPLREFPVGVIGEFDSRLASFVEAVAKLDRRAIRTALAVVKVGEMPVEF